MWEEIQRNLAVIRRMRSESAPDLPQVVTYTFPLRLAAGLPDDDGYRVSAFADHLAASGQVLDYNGGVRTYDGHHGTDYALWPFSWNKVDAGEMQVIAVAAGTIVYYSNVDPTDHNCVTSSNDTWNAIALVHADGRMTLYGHMRYNSLTSKVVGQSVAQGEYLGTAASSGNSSGPHLHYEVRYGTYTSAEWMDPYAGPGSQPTSLWASQRPYLDSAINRLTTHASPPSTPDACQPSITNLQDNFTTPGRIYFYVYYRDFQGALATWLKITRPDGSTYSSWQYAPAGTAFSPVWYQGWAYQFSASDPAGTWRFEATYNGQAHETFFNVNAPATLNVKSPNGGELWDLRHTHSLSWADNIGGDVNIALYRNGAYASSIAYNTPSNGSYEWSLDPALPPGSGYTVRVSSVIRSASFVLFDESDAPFTLTDGPVITARHDIALMAVNNAVVIDALRNDEESNGSPVSIAALGTPAHGAIKSVNAMIIYTPTLDFVGADTFTYTASAGVVTADATITVRVASQIHWVYTPFVSR